MIITTTNAKMSSLLDMYQDVSINPQFNEEGQPIITKEMYSKYIDFVMKDYNYLVGNIGGNPPIASNPNFWNILTLETFRLMWFIRDYFRGEFDFRGDEDFFAVWPIVVENWYFGKVWVIKDYEVMNLEIELANTPTYKQKVRRNKLKKGNPFRLFADYREENGKYIFKSLLTGIEEFELNPDDMVCFTLDDGQKFWQWWRINLAYIAGQSRVIDAYKGLSKTVSVIVSNEELFRKEAEQIDNSSILYQMFSKRGDANGDNLYQSMPMIEGHRVRDMWDLNETMYQKWASQLGMVLNTNDKRERLTVAENYKDLRTTANLQDAYLDNLKITLHEMKKKGWIGVTDTVRTSGMALGEGIPNARQQGNSPEGFGDKKPDRPFPKKEEF